MYVFDVKKLTVCVFMALSSANLAATAADLSEFEKWQKQRAEQFNQYVTQQDQDFTQFLKQRWLVKKVESAPKRDTQPKIQRPPTAPKKEAEPDASKTVKVLKPKPIVKPTPAVINPERVKPSIPKPVPTPSKPLPPGLESISFLGNQLSFNKLELLGLPLANIDAETIASSWQVMASSKNNKLVNLLEMQAHKLGLDDWGRAYLTHQVIAQGAKQLNSNEVNLYSWYYLMQQGFDSRVGYDNGQVHLLVKVAQPLYGQKFFRFGDDKYYFVNFNADGKGLGSKIKTYQNQHELAKADLTLDLAKIPKVLGEQSHRELTFNYGGKKHEISVPYHKEYAEFLNLYPQMELEHYFQSGLEASSREVLLNYLAQEIEGKTEKQALNLLLRFVQYAFPYQTDDQQFNKENFLVATETLHYPYADCEDRAVLFSYLVKNLLGNKIIGVLYQGHIATAIKTNSDIKGAWYKVKGEKFLVADPTYIGASLGQVMPGYEQAYPQLVVIN